MSDLLTLNTASHMLTLDHIIPESDTARDITADVNNRIFVPIPPAGRVRHRHICIVGKIESGKSTLSNYLAWTGINYYGAENVNIVHTDDPRVALELTNERPVQLFIIADATSKASSREIHKQTEFIKNYNKCRHIYEDKYPGRPGIIIFIFDWQRWIELDPALRDGHIIFFKTGMTGKQDKNDILDKLEKDYFGVLNQIWDRMERGDDKVKGLSVARIASKMPEDGGVGIYISRMVENVLPTLIRSDEFFKADTATEADILDKYRAQPKWALRIECYEMFITDEYTQSEIADSLSAKHGRTIRQGYVSEAVAKVKELLKK